MKIITELDQFEIEEIRDLVRSKGWQLITEKVRQMRASQVTNLIAAHNEIASNMMRGQIAACDTFLDLPSIVHNEIRAHLKGNK